MRAADRLKDALRHRGNIEILEARARAKAKRIIHELKDRGVDFFAEPSAVAIVAALLQSR